LNICTTLCGPAAETMLEFRACIVRACFGYE
jgi:hypothetical protein